MAVETMAMASSYTPSSSEQLLQSMEESEDIVTWVNQLIDNRSDGQDTEDLSELEKHLSHLTAAVEVACEDTSAQLERTIDDVSRTVPRLAYDLQFMQESALSLNAALHHLEQASQSSLGSTNMSQVLDRMHFLDTVQRNMSASLAVLREAEAWSSLESEVLAFISEQAYSRAAARLSEAASSLGVFQNTPEYESRKTLMVNLQNQLEAALSSALVAAINGSDMDACKRYFGIFCDIERETEFRSYWNGSKRKGLVTRWESVALKDCDEISDGEQSDMRFAVFLSEFYNEMLSLLQVERLSAMAIFPDPQATLSSFVSTTLSSSIHPSPSQRLSSLVTHHGDLVLPELISAFKSTEEFALSVEKIMEKANYSAPTPAVPPMSLEGETGDGSSLTRSHSRRKSHRQSISRRLVSRGSSGTGSHLLAGTAVADMDRAWEESLFEPFLDFQCDYGALENRLLTEQLKSIIQSNPAGLPISAAGARLLRERAVDVLASADDASTRCMAFTHGYGAFGLIQAIDSLFRSFLEISENDVLNPRNPRSDPSAGQAAGDEFADLDYSASDYATIQLTLHLLEASRDILERLSSFESKLRSTLVQFAGTLKLMRSDPSGLYISGTTKGALGLLQGSALNSLDLQRLLDSIDPDARLNPAQGQNQTPLTPSFHRTPSGNTLKNILSTPLLTGSRAAISGFAKACQSRLQKTILAPLLKHLAGYSSLPIWSASADSQKRSAAELAIPTFSRSPTPAIQGVAEGLLSLPRLFEVYADDDALAFEIGSLPFVDLRMLSGEDVEGDEGGASFRTSGGAGESEGDADGASLKASRRRSIIPNLTPAPSVSPTAKPSPLTPEVVTSAWLVSLALSLLAHLTRTVLPTIPVISESGAAQLAEDLGYLGHIVKALNVTWEELEAWREAVEVDEAEMRARSAEEQSDTAKRIMELVWRKRLPAGQ